MTPPPACSGFLRPALPLTGLAGWLSLWSGGLFALVGSAALAAALWSCFALRDPKARGRIWIWAATAGLAALCLPGLFAGPEGEAMGAGEALVGAVLLLILALGLADRGVLRGDSFSLGALVLLAALTAVFVAYPLARMLAGGLAAEGFAGHLTAPALWSLGPLTGGPRLGLLWRTLWLALASAAGSVFFGLCLALLAARTELRFKGMFRLLALSPLVAPPFVTGLALILLFGRSGLATQAGAEALGLEPGRWLYGLTGVWLAQVLAFAPGAFLLLLAAAGGAGAVLEEAARSLGAGRWRVFWTVSLPLMRPALANAFLLGFVESLADFGNPLLLGGSQGVLSTEIFFAVAGASADPARAAALAFWLLAFALAAFLAQRLWLGEAHGGRRFVAISAEGGFGAGLPLPGGLKILLWTAAAPWLILATAVYAMIFLGGFVRLWGLDHGLTPAHHLRAFGIGWEGGAIRWTGAAWESFGTTLKIALIAAPLAAGLGILAAWLLARRPFAASGAFEFALTAGFAIPGVVFGVSYVAAFNAPPLALTGTSLILIACFVFRNLPAALRSGLAAMSRIDPSLEEASRVLGAGPARSFLKADLPLLRPAIPAALVYAFVRTLTSASAAVFLVSAEHHLATIQILGWIESGDYGPAAAYASALILTALGAVALLRLLTGGRASA